MVPVVMYKGMKNGLIQKRELTLHDPMCIYETQDNAWINKRAMLRWVDEVILMPYVSLVPLGIIPLILLDLYQCHIMALVINVIQYLGCKVVHIPGGCTGLVQPLDVGYNKPLKTSICACWEEDMINEMRMNGSISMLLHLDVSAWVAEAYWDLENSPIVEYAWLKINYNWF